MRFKDKFFNMNLLDAIPLCIAMSFTLIVYAFILGMITLKTYEIKHDINDNDLWTKILDGKTI